MRLRHGNPSVLRLGLGALLATGVAGCGGGMIGEGLSPDAQSLPDARSVVPDAEPAPDAPPCPGSSSGPATYYRDLDEDGYGDPGQAMLSCEPVAGFVTSSTDCDDDQDSVNPGATEVCGDYLDNDCTSGDPCTQSLLAHWRLDDGLGTTASDASGHDLHGSLRNQPAWTGDSTALAFDGIDDYVEIAHDPSFLVGEGTVVLWFRAKDLTALRGLWSKDSNGNDTGGHLSIFTTNPVDTTVPRIRMRLQSVTSSYALTSPEIVANRWYHVAVSFGPDGMRLRVDGDLVATNAYTGGLGETSGGTGNAQPLVLGAMTWNSGDLTVEPVTDHFIGDIDDVRVFDRALSAAEIQDLYSLTTPTF